MSLGGRLGDGRVGKVGAVTERGRLRGQGKDDG